MKAIAQERAGAGGFTLMEIMLAAVAGALILAAIYAVFSGAIRMRDKAVARTQDARLRARASDVLRNDLRNGLVSGGIIASSLEGSVSSQGSRFPGFLRFTTTTGAADGVEVGGDVQEVEYYISTDPDASQRNTGQLVRVVHRNLLAEQRDAAVEQPVLADVSSMEVSFFDGQSWIESWEVSEDDKTTPKGVRVVLRRGQDPVAKNAFPPLEITVPWATEAATNTPAVQ